MGKKRNKAIMEEKKRYSANNKLYEIDKSEVLEFLKDFPEATEVEIYTANNKTYGIPFADTSEFLKDFPKAKALKKKGNGESLLQGGTSVLQDNWEEITALYRGEDIEKIPKEEEITQTVKEEEIPKEEADQISFKEYLPDLGYSVEEFTGTNLSKELPLDPQKEITQTVKEEEKRLVPKAKEFTREEMREMSEQLSLATDKLKGIDISDVKGKEEMNLERQEMALRAAKTVIENEYDITELIAGHKAENPEISKMFQNYLKINNGLTEVIEKKKELGIAPKGYFEKLTQYKALNTSAYPRAFAIIESTKTKKIIDGYLASLSDSNPEVYKEITEQLERGTLSPYKQNEYIIQPALTREMNNIANDIEILKARGDENVYGLIDEYNQVLDKAKQQILKSDHKTHHGWGSLKEFNKNVAGTLRTIDNVAKFILTIAGADEWLSKDWRQTGMFSKAADYIERQDETLPDMPEDWVGTALTAGVGVAELMAEMYLLVPKIPITKLAKATGATPKLVSQITKRGFLPKQILANATGGAVTGIPQIVTLEAAKGFFDEFDKGMEDEKLDWIDAGKITESTTKGIQYGMMLHLMGASSKSIAEFAAAAGFVSGKFMPSMIGMSSSVGMFTIYDAYEQWKQTGKVDLAKALATGVGVSLFSIPGLAKNIAQDKYVRARSKFLTASSDIINLSAKIKKSPAEMLKLTNDLKRQILAETNEGRRAELQNNLYAVEKFIDLKIMTNAIIENPSCFHREIELDKTLNFREKYYFYRLIENTLKQAPEKILSTPEFQRKVVINNILKLEAEKTALINENREGKNDNKIKDVNERLKLADKNLKAILTEQEKVRVEQEKTKLQKEKKEVETKAIEKELKTDFEKFLEELDDGKMEEATLMIADVEKKEINTEILNKQINKVSREIGDLKKQEGKEKEIEAKETHRDNLEILLDEVKKPEIKHPIIKEVKPEKKKISISRSKSIEEIRELDKYKGLGKMEAGILSAKFKKQKIITSPAKGLQTKILDKLVEKDYVKYDSYENTYSLTKKGEEFIKAINARVETRRAVKEGTDLFPEEANIPEIEKPAIKEKEVIKKIKPKKEGVGSPEEIIKVRQEGEIAAEKKPEIKEGEPVGGVREKYKAKAPPKKEAWEITKKEFGKLVGTARTGYKLSGYDKKYGFSGKWIDSKAQELFIDKLTKSQKKKLDEYSKIKTDIGLKKLQISYDYHKGFVKQALSEGKTPYKGWEKDYPDLVKEKPIEKKEVTEIKEKVIPKEYDTKDKQRLRSVQREGEKTVKALPNKISSKEKIKADRILETQKIIDEIKKAETPKELSDIAKQYAKIKKPLPKTVEGEYIKTDKEVKKYIEERQKELLYQKETEIKEALAEKKEKVGEALRVFGESIGAIKMAYGDKKPEVIKSLVNLANEVYDLGMLKAEDLIFAMRKEVKKLYKGEQLKIMNKAITQNKAEIIKGFPLIQEKFKKTQIQKDIEKTTKSVPNEFVREYWDYKKSLEQPSIFRAGERQAKRDWNKIQKEFTDWINERKDIINKLGVKLKPAILNKVNNITSESTLKTAIDYLDNILKKRKYRETENIKQKIIETVEENIKKATVIESGVPKAKMVTQEGLDNLNLIRKCLEYNKEKKENEIEKIDKEKTGVEDKWDKADTEEKLNQAEKEIFLLETKRDIIEEYSGIHEKSYETIVKLSEKLKSDIKFFKEEFKKQWDEKITKCRETGEKLAIEVGGGEARIERLTIRPKKVGTIKAGYVSYIKSVENLPRLMQRILKNYLDPTKEFDYNKSTAKELVKKVEEGLEAEKVISVDLKNKVESKIKELFGGVTKYNQLTNKKATVELTEDLGGGKTKKALRERFEYGSFAYLWACYKSQGNHDYTQRINYAGRRVRLSEENFKKIDKILPKSLKDYTDWLVTDFFPYARKLGEGAFEKRTLRKLPVVEDYLPIKANSQTGRQNISDIGSLDLFKSMFKKRTGGEYDLLNNNITTSVSVFINDFSKHVGSSNPVNELSKALNYKKTINMLKIGGGLPYKLDIDKRLEDFMGMNRQDRGYGNILYKNFIMSKIRMNPMTIPKQMTSMFNVLDGSYAPTGEVLKSMWDLSTKTKIRKRAVEIVGKTQGIKTRYISDIVSNINVKNENKYISKVNNLTEEIQDNYVGKGAGRILKALWNPSQKFDRVAIYGGGIPLLDAVYRIEYKKQINLKATPKEASKLAAKEAIYRFNAWMNTSQQSAESLYKSHYQTNTVRYIIPFTNAIMGYSRKVMEGHGKVYKSFRHEYERQLYKNPDINRGRAAIMSMAKVDPQGLKQILMYQVIMPVLFQSVATGGRNWADMWHEDEEKKRIARVEMFYDATLKWTEALPVAGQISNYLFDRFWGKHYWGRNLENIGQFLSDIQRIIDGFASIKTQSSAKKEAETDKEYDKAIKKLVKARDDAISGAFAVIGAPSVALDRVTDTQRNEYYDNVLKNILRWWGVSDKNIKEWIPPEEK